MKKQDNIHIIADLLNKHLEGVLSQSEQVELDAWLAESEENRSLFNALNDKAVLLEKLNSYSQVDSKAIWQKTQQLINPGAKVIPLVPVTRSWRKYVVAAAVAGIAVAGTWFFYFKSADKNPVAQQQATVEVPQEIVPGSSKATLTLADGKQIVLNDASDGKDIKEGNIVISRNLGRLIYNNGEAGANGQDPIAVGSQALYHTVSTPKGGQYQIKLPDGSIVWLNAASSLRFPIAFAGSERHVLLTGEAFFEVKPMSDKPFKVAVQTPLGNGGEIEVLGTHFNVNAYTDDELVRTTLLEGSVKIATSTSKNILKPGQAATVDKNGGLKVIKKADTESAASWKNGFFTFKETSAQVVMQQVGRWYNLEIEYAGKAPVNKLLNGNIPRNYSIEEVMKVLKVIGMQVSLDKAKRKILVTS
jgi:ferric-dicitrate binding protein FerR (iron transport regulator)